MGTNCRNRYSAITVFLPFHILQFCPGTAIFLVHLTLNLITGISCPQVQGHRLVNGCLFCAGRSNGHGFFDKNMQFLRPYLIALGIIHIDVILRLTQESSIDGHRVRLPQECHRCAIGYFICLIGIRTFAAGSFHGHGSLGTLLQIDGLVLRGDFLAVQLGDSRQLLAGNQQACYRILGIYRGISILVLGIDAYPELLGSFIGKGILQHIGLGILQNGYGIQAAFSVQQPLIPVITGRLHIGSKGDLLPCLEAGTGVIQGHILRQRQIHRHGEAVNAGGHIGLLNNGFFILVGFIAPDWS